MGSSESTGREAGSAPITGEEVRRATFPQALRGYDRDAVHSLLDRVADLIEGKASAVGASPAMRDQLAKVGERTAGILTAAEEAAQELRDDAARYAENLRKDVEDEARASRLNTSQRMDEMIADAESKAKRIIDDAVARRRQLNQAISSLLERRDEIAADAAKLAEELLDAVEALRTPPHDDSDADALEPVPGPETDDEVPDAFGPPGYEEPSDSEELSQPAFEQMPAGTEGEPDPTDEDEGEDADALEQEDSEEMDSFAEDDEEETEVFGDDDSEETQIFATDDSDAPRTPRLLVDPDEDEDDTPPRGFVR
jgi:DivIVA domain-containing protein